MHYYRLQTKLWKGNVFTPVCQSFCSQERVSARGGVHPSMHWTDSPWADTPTPSPLAATAEDGKQPTGMHSCIIQNVRLRRLCFYTCLSFCPGGGLPHCMLGYTPGTRGKHPPPRGRYPPGPEAGTPTPLGPEADTPWTRGRYPPQSRPPWEQTPPGTRGRYPPRCSACWEIRATSGWYASYWNAILYCTECFTLRMNREGQGQVLGRTGNRLISRTRSCTSWSVSMGFSGERFLLDIGPGSVQCDYIIWDTVLV